MRAGLARRLAIAGAVVVAIAASTSSAALGSAATAQAVDTVRVAVHPVPPFVIEDPDGDLSGFSVDLAQAIADKAGLELELVRVADVSAQLRAVESGEADMAIGAISITAEREERVDFTQPIFESGIKIAARPGTASSDAGWLLSFRVFTPALLTILTVAVLGTLLAGALVWRLERRHNPEFAAPARRGVFDGIWWAIETLFAVTYGDKVPKRTGSRILATLWMFVAVLLIATLIAEVTTNRTVERLDATIESVGDLYGKDVVAVPGTTSEALLAENGIDTRAVDGPEDGLSQVADGSADAFVYDSAILRYLIAADGTGVELVGPLLRAESYGIAVPTGSDVLEPLNRALLRLRETGAYDRLVDAYFG